MADTRTIEEGLLIQGEDESIAYKLDVSAVGSSPTSPSVVVKDATAGGTDVTSTVMPSGSPSVTGDVITLPPLKLLTADHSYIIEVQYTISGNVFETYFHVRAAE